MTVAPLLLAATLAAPGDEWTIRDSVLEAGVVLTLALDYCYTLEIADKGLEANLLLGPRPSRALVTGYFLAAGALHVGVALALPAEWRFWWQIAWIAIEVGVCVHNHVMGWRLEW